MTDILFITLRTFSATGGIEKVCRVAGKAIYEFGIENNKSVAVWSMYDEPKAAFNNPYFPSEIFMGFGIKKIGFIKNAVMEGRKADVVVISHLNLLVVGWLIKKLSPATKVILFTHGIEVWAELDSFKKKMLRTCDQILAVSNYTKNKIIEMHGVDPLKCHVLNNCLDPFLPLPDFKFSKTELFKKYNFSESDKIVFTLTRLSVKEKYKGYDTVVAALALLKDSHKNIKYVIAGSYDEEEKEALTADIKRAGLENRVIIAGFIPDEELASHFAMADIYVMPSRKEGFGIVFIEAMYYGTPVIAGNVDGSTDALLNGKLGTLIDPFDTRQLADAISNILANRENYIPDERTLLNNFSYEVYKKHFNRFLKQATSNAAAS